MIALGKLSKLDQISHSAEVRDAVVEHDNDVEYHDAEVHGIRPTHQYHHIEQFVDASDTHRTHQSNHHCHMATR